VLRLEQPNIAIPPPPQDKSATAYTVFCAEQAPSCQIAGELPFVFSEGPDTLVYTGSDPGTLSVIPTPSLSPASRREIHREWAQSLTTAPSSPLFRTADLRCKLDGTTAATCTGSSSFGANYRDGTLTGPTQTSWTRTFAAAEVTWGVLTLTTPGPLPGTTDIDGTVVVPDGTYSGSIPAPTSAGSGSHRQLRRRAGADVTTTFVAAVMLGFLIFG
jgi:hypothetical protein